MGDLNEWQEALSDEMSDRCELAFDVVPLEGREPEAVNAVGVLVVGWLGEALAVDVGVGTDGSGTVVVRRFDPSGKPVEPLIVASETAAIIASHS